VLTGKIVLPNLLVTRVSLSVAVSSSGFIGLAVDNLLGRRLEGGSFLASDHFLASFVYHDLSNSE
jgi:hypothetical protein